MSNVNQRENLTKKKRELKKNNKLKNQIYKNE